ncbi:MAG: VWA domain-containing protein, partial [Opitutia bacterium]
MARAELADRRGHRVDALGARQEVGDHRHERAAAQRAGEAAQRRGEGRAAGGGAEGEDVADDAERLTAPLAGRHPELLAVDVSGSGSFGSGRATLRERAAEVAACLAVSALRAGDRAGLLLFTDREELWVPPRKGRRQALRIIRDVLSFRPASRRAEQPQEGPQRAAPVLHRTGHGSDERRVRIEQRRRARAAAADPRGEGQPREQEQRPGALV